MKKLIFMGVLGLFLLGSCNSKSGHDHEGHDHGTEEAHNHDHEGHDHNHEGHHVGRASRGSVFCCEPHPRADRFFQCPFDSERFFGRCPRLGGFSRDFCGFTLTSCLVPVRRIYRTRRQHRHYGSRSAGGIRDLLCYSR